MHPRLLVLMVCLYGGPLRAESYASLYRSVLKISVSKQQFDFKNPWRKGDVYGATGSGFYIGDDRILTNAHVVSNATFITAQRYGDDRPVVAAIEFVADDADLAILTVVDKAYFKRMRPLRFGRLPQLRSPVVTIGYPMGGEQIAITEGVVSRIDYRTYVHDGHSRHLALQVDSAINPGASGGPVLQSGKVIGVAFQSNLAAQSVGYVIPTPVVERLLADVADGSYEGHAAEGVVVSPLALSNPATRRFYGLQEAQGGVPISYVERHVPEYRKLQVGDILTAVDGIAVGIDGRIEFQGQRLDFEIVRDLRQRGDLLTYEVIRGGKVLQMPVRVGGELRRYLPGNMYRRPDYLVYAGLVFTTMSRSYLARFGDKLVAAPLGLKYAHLYADFEPQLSDVEQVIVLADRLPHIVNAYVASQINQILTTVNGEKVRSVAHLQQVLQAKARFLRFDFLDGGEPIVLDRREAEAAQEAINREFQVDPDFSVESLR